MGLGINLCATQTQTHTCSIFAAVYLFAFNVWHTRTKWPWGCDHWEYAWRRIYLASLRDASEVPLFYIMLYKQYYVEYTIFIFYIYICMHILYTTPLSRFSDSFFIFLCVRKRLKNRDYITENTGSKSLQIFLTWSPSHMLFPSLLSLKEIRYSN